jgi:hypothetical protein
MGYNNSQLVVSTSCARILTRTLIYSWVNPPPHVLGETSGVGTEHKNQGKELWPATAWAGRNVTRNATQGKKVRRKSPHHLFEKKFAAALRAAPQKTEERKCKGIKR